MRDINAVIREKEAELARINEELAALRLAARLLSDEPVQESRTPREDSSKPAPVRIKNFP
jgi:hypothetical protein